MPSGPRPILNVRRPDTRYAYAVSRIRALEAQLVDRAMVDRLLGETPEGLLRWARESDYASAFAEVETPDRFPAGLHRHLSETFTLFDRIAPEPELMRVFRLRYDYHNLGLLFKARVLGREDISGASDLGTIPFDRLATIVSDEDWLQLAPQIRDTWHRAEDLQKRQRSLQVVSTAFENGRYKHTMAIARAYRNQLLLETFPQVITMHNIVTFLRVKDGAARREDFADLLLEGGALGDHFYSRHFDEPVQLFLEALGSTEYARHILIQGIDALPETRAYWRLDIARDNYFLYYLRKTSADCFSIGPLVWYLMRKKAELKLLRTLWLAGRAGWDRATVRDRLRSVYA